MTEHSNGRPKPAALNLLSSERPRNVGWLQAAGLLFGDWGTSRLYVLGLAFLFAGRTSFWLILAMSGLTLAVGWAYAHICRIYPDGGGVYTAAKGRSRTLAVVGALLLFADYTVTASLSSLAAFHYFGLPVQRHAQVDAAAQVGRAADGVVDAGYQIVIERSKSIAPREGLLAWDSPGLWAIVAIGVLGFLNLLGPKHTGRYALFAAIGMVAITLLITASALPQVQWRDLVPAKLGGIDPHPVSLWVGFVSIVLALSGVEAVANLTGVMKKPVAHTARKAIWAVAAEVALFNLILIVCLLAISNIDRHAHADDMLAFLTRNYLGPWGEWPVRILGGLLLLSASNTAVNGMMSILYVMSRDGELPAVLQKLNRFGSPWLGAIAAAAAPIIVLLAAHDTETLASLYAIGVIGAIAVNVSLCSVHPRLRRMRRKLPMMVLGLVLAAIWLTLAYTKLHALLFVTVVMIVGLIARRVGKVLAARSAKPSLLRQAIAEALAGDALSRPKLLLGSYGSEVLAPAAMYMARQQSASLVVCFIREVTLSYKHETDIKLTLDTDVAAQRAFARFLELGHQVGVPIIPVYDTGADAAVLVAENAAIYGCERVLIGSSRKGALYRLVKGAFQRRLEVLLPPEIPVQVINADMLSDEARQQLSRAQEEPAPGH